mmetsp:Transcript_11764/g.18866  ORF Transcript_11764/g.18866 Transcript_11764/m.18866 type:complete len:225 (+) Transcript_11764:69-743(+)
MGGCMSLFMSDLDREVERVRTEYLEALQKRRREKARSEEDKTRRLEERRQRVLDNIQSGEQKEPQVSKILPYLLLGGEKAAASHELLIQHRVEWILNVSDNVPCYFPAEFSYKVIEVEDHEHENLIMHFPACFNFIKAARSAYHRSNLLETTGDKARGQFPSILIHCHQGVSRSVTVVCAWLMETKNLSAQEALEFVREKRPIVDPNKGFIEQLNEFDKKVVQR